MLICDLSAFFNGTVSQVPKSEEGFEASWVRQCSWVQQIEVTRDEQFSSGSIMFHQFFIFSSVFHHVLIIFHQVSRFQKFDIHILPHGALRYAENLGDFVYAAAGPAVQAEQSSWRPQKRLWFIILGAIDLIHTCIHVYIYIYIFTCCDVMTWWLCIFLRSPTTWWHSCHSCWLYANYG